MEEKCPALTSKILAIHMLQIRMMLMISEIWSLRAMDKMKMGLLKQLAMIWEATWMMPKVQILVYKNSNKVASQVPLRTLVQVKVSILWQTRHWAKKKQMSFTAMNMKNMEKFNKMMILMRLIAANNKCQKNNHCKVTARISKMVNNHSMNLRTTKLFQKIRMAGSTGMNGMSTGAFS